MGVYTTASIYSVFPCPKAVVKSPVRARRPMTILQIAIVAFAAGFLSCAALAAAIVLWAFADKRAGGMEPVTSNKQQQQPRAA